MAGGVTEPYSGGMGEPAYEMTLEELADSPDLWGEALRSVARGRVVHLVRGDHEHVADLAPEGALEELEETVEVLADSDAVRALIEAREAAARGDVVRGVDAVRALSTSDVTEPPGSARAGCARVEGAGERIMRLAAA
jgi:antitoxin YefM